MPNLANLTQCTGCTACSAVCPKQCIEMKKDAEGFLHPFVNSDQCIQCHLCEKVCPVLSDCSVNKVIPSACAVISKDESIRLDSSSGGFFSELSTKILEDNGYIYGAAYNELFEVHHICVDNVNDLSKLRGAKYSQSNLGDTFIDIKTKLDQNIKVLFSGTPCQVAGLKSYLRKEYDNLICVDFVCHGVPSPMAWKEYIKYRSELDNQGELPVSINLRSKDTGWSKYTYSNLFEYKNGKKQYNSSSDSLFMKLFVGDYINRLSCSDCKFKGYSRVSDFTIGDFWGIWDIDPVMDDNKGTSVVLVQSEKGKKLLDEIKNNLIIKEVTLEQASQQNPSMLVSSSAKPNRSEVLEMIRDGRISECEKMFVVKAPSFTQKIKGKLSRLMHKVRNHE
ncbi:MAG: Coenzyme F420 hydrogenase/dehydrogenase, beta subunit C-terminal domain [Erysipelotrichaceae bacterium]|nr:Coenzyme F420 hydrogenase/dehydrogenase, beta subunit C-terminal domain [Erysipelotrichaceae bacterium]